MDNTTKIKKTTDEVAIVATARVDLETQVSKMKEELANSNREIETLKGEAQKTTLALEELLT